MGRRLIFLTLVCVFIFLSIINWYTNKSSNVITHLTRQLEPYFDILLSEGSSKPHTEQPKQSNRITTSFVKSTYPHEKVPFVQTADSNVFLYSAIIIHKISPVYYSTDTLTKDIRKYKPKYILVNGWVDRNVHSTKCCYYLINRTIVSVSSSASRTRDVYVSLPLKSVQFTCSWTDDVLSIKGVSIATNDNQCIQKERYYIKPIHQVEGDPSDIAVCSQITYGSIKAEELLEWFEVQRLLGVQKILVYTYKLNKKAMNVLDHYESTGLAIVRRDFDFPLKDIYPRDVDMRNLWAWNDLQMLINDCQARLNGFKYVGVIDKDEFIIPRNIRSYNFSMKVFLDKVFTDEIAAINMQTVQHITTWGPSNITSKLFLERYINSTAPMQDRMKNIYMPSRVKTGLISIHAIVPENGYKSIMMPASVISLHHYRTCRNETNLKTYSISHNGYKEHRQPDDMFYYKSNDICLDFKRYNNLSKDLDHIIAVIKDRVLKLQVILGIQ